MKKRILIPMLVACGLSLAACGQKAATNESNTVAKEGTEDTNADVKNSGQLKEIAVQFGSTPETMDPALNSAADAGNTIIHAFEGLLKMDKDTNVIPGLAESYEVSEDGLVYTFKLREGLKWSDGTPLTANDFVYSWKRLVNPDTAAPYAFDTLGVVAGFEEATEGGNIDALKVSAPDDLTFVVELKNPVAYFDQVVTFTALVPVQEATVEANGETWALNPETYITSGPYKMVEYADGDRIVYEKNENYYDKDKITFDRITFRLIEDGNAAYTAYKQGEIALEKTVPSEEVPSLVGTDEFHVDPLMGTYYVSFNTTKAPLDNAKIRKALSLVIDRDYVANTIMQGTYFKANSVVGTGISDAKEGSLFMDVAKEYTRGVNSDDYEADVLEAQALLAEAGYPNGEGLDTIEYSFNDSGYHKAVAEYLQSVWKEKLGVNVELAVKEWKVFQADRNNQNYDIARHGWILDWNDPSNILNLFVSTSGNNDGRVSIAAYDELMQKAANTIDKEERYKYMHEAEKILIDEAGVAPIAHYADFYLMNSNLKNVWHSPYGYFYLMYGSVEE